MSKRLPTHVPAASPDQPAIWRSLGEKRDPVGTARDAESEPSIQRPDPSLDVSLGDLMPSKARVGRRGFMAVGGATAAAVGLSGCLRRPVDHILPHSHAPEYAVPGIPLHYATSVSHAGEGFGLLVESHEGRPTKIEGNPEHPASLGSTDARLQAMTLDLYDPDRSAAPKQRGNDEAVTWSDFDRFWRTKATELAGNGGQGLRVLAPPTDSPSFLRARAALLARFPSAVVHTYAPLDFETARAGASLAFGAPQSVQYDYARAQTVLSVDADFLGSEPGYVRNAKGFAARRGIERPTDEMNRLYVVESTLSLTGMNADHRVRLAPSKVEGFLRALAAKLAAPGGVAMPAAIAGAVRSARPPEGVDARFVDALAAELTQNRGRSIITVGWRQPARVHALAHALNMALGNVGSTVRLFAPAETEEPATLADLAEAMRGGQVDTLVILGGNPVYDAPADLRFAQALERVETSIHLADRVDETSAACVWHLPMAHALESWGDHRAADGTLSIQQPLIAPLRGGRSDIELLAMMGGIRGWRGYHLVRGTLRASVAEAGFERAWRQSLHRGVVAGAPRLRPQMASLADAAVAAALTESAPPAGDGIELCFTPSYQVWDGRHANNAWLQELPDPVTKVVWDNCAYVSPTTAATLGIEPPARPQAWLPQDMEAWQHGALLTISRDGVGEITIAAYVVPGHPDGVVTLPLGFGRTAAGRHGDGVGVDVYPLRTSDSLGFATGVTVARAGGAHDLVHTQEHHRMVGRALSIDATLEHYRETPTFPQFRTEERHANPTPSLGPLWTQVDYGSPDQPPQGGTSYSLWPSPRQARPGAPPRYKWGMVIDLSRCTGCSACVIACQSENNIAVVGKRQVELGREMHWMRIDRYFVGDDAGDPQVALQPVACQHCEEAPCENVCPVAATIHSPEGLNEMTYNRCIGTRYCANNCPYKVRRFNYLDYHGDVPELQRMVFNPNVTVRMRGVMEKCTFCVQRIQYARIQARQRSARDPNGPVEEERIGAGELTPACAQACPSDAMTFGDLNDTASPVHRRAHMDRQYKLLPFLGTQPRTTFLGKIRNPNPELS